MRKLSDWLHRVSPGGVALAALAIFVLFTALVLPGQNAQADEYGGDVGSPDLSFFYSTADLYTMAEAYGPEGRAAYVRARLTFDVVWPVVYTVFLVTALSWLTRQAFAAGSPWQRANLIPLAAALFDYLENAATSLVMARYPARMPGVDVLATLFTPLKWVFVVAGFVLLLVCVGVSVFRPARKVR